MTCVMFYRLIGLVSFISHVTVTYPRPYWLTITVAKHKEKRDFTSSVNGLQLFVLKLFSWV